MNVLTVEPESTKTRIAAPPAEEPRPDVAEVEAEPLDLSSIDPKMLKMASKMGIPLEQIINWASSVEQRLNAIQQEMPAQIQKSMEAAIESQRQKQIQALQQAAAAGGGQQPMGGGGIGLMDIIKLAAGSGGGGGMDEEMQRLTREIMRANLDRIKQDASFTDAIKTAIVTKIAGRAASTIADGII